MTGEVLMFALPPRRAAKASPRLIGTDGTHLARVAEVVEGQIAALVAELDALRLQPGGAGRGAMERDLNIHRLSARLGVLRRFGHDLCLGRMVPDDGSRPVYVGRIGVIDDKGEALLVDWRTPAAEPFFAATAANRMGLASRRRYLWRDGMIVDYWDEAFTAAGHKDVALDDDSAFIASLGESRSPRMRDVLATIQADQDAIIRAGSAGALVVDGGPGTGKTVVALHRAAYLLYSDPRLAGHRGGVLFVGPNTSYLRYVSDVLPALGEDGVLTCTLRDLVPEGAVARQEIDPVAARVKSSDDMARAVEPAVAFYEEPPGEDIVVETGWGDVAFTPGDWREAIASVEQGTPHNEARDDIWQALLEIGVDNGVGEDVPREALRAALAANDQLRDQFGRVWPVLDATELVGDLWAVPAYLRLCAPWIDPDDARALRRPEGSPLTVEDLPLLDAMRARLGDPAASGRRRREEAELTADRHFMDDVVQDLLDADDDPESPLPLLRRESLRRDLLHADALPDDPRDRLAGPFAHIVVDEAQELTDAEWQMLLRRCPSGSITAVGDRAQSRRGFAESWHERLGRVGLGTVRQATLTVNYRTPREVMAVAEPVIRAVLPDANVPASIREGGEPVLRAPIGEVGVILDGWLASHPEGTACVIGLDGFSGRERVRAMDAVEAKGQEFDLVIVADGALGDGIAGAVDRYVAMSRATSRLVLLEG